jgi:hypothetical protein
LGSYTWNSKAAKAYRERYETGCKKLSVPTKQPQASSKPVDKTIHELWVRAVKSGAAPARACYREALSIWPELDGDAWLRLMIDEHGSVQAFAVRGENAGLRAVGCCLGESSLRWKFHDQPKAVVLPLWVRFRNAGPAVYVPYPNPPARQTIYDPHVPGSEDR